MSSSTDSIAVSDGAVVVVAEEIDVKGEPAIKTAKFFLLEAIREGAWSGLL
jgi:hypothetical protein